MATVIPENLLTNRSVAAGHRRVAKALLVNLDDSATVWFEPPFEPAGERRRPDFVVLDPSLGVVVVMVFEQVEGQEVLGAIRGELRVLDAGAEAPASNPLQLADKFVSGLRTRLDSDAALRQVPVGGIAVFPYPDRAAAEQLSFDTVIPLDRCLFKDEIDLLVRGDGSFSLFRFLARVLEGGVDDLIDDSVQAQVRGLIHPEVVIGSTSAQGSLFVDAPDDSASVPRVMDLHQERFAKRLHAGHRVIHGVAGSGKTLILVARARLLANLYPSARMLVTCYTKALASVLKAQLAECPNVEVENLDAKAFRIIVASGAKPPPFNGPQSMYKVALDIVTAEQLQPYRAVFVDEAQDFDDDALRLCVALAEPGADGMADVLIVADASQRIYDRRFSWSSAGIQARGRTSVLRHNYRNTKEILEFASSFVAADVESDDSPVAVATRDDLDLDDETLIVPAETTDRHGPAPQVEVVEDPGAEVDRILAMVEGWYSDRLPARSIAVLLQSDSEHDLAATIVAGLRDRGIASFWATEDRESKARVGMVEDAVVVSTIHSAKGLEFPRVVVCGLHHRGSGERALRNRNTVYVGFTRAIDELAVVADRSSPYVAALTAPDHPTSSRG